MKIQTNKRVLVGKVLSDKMEKTIVVAVERVYRHPIFKKVLKNTKTYKVHDPEKAASVGDVVEFYEGRPVSKTKYMYFSRIIRGVEKKSDNVEMGA